MGVLFIPFLFFVIYLCGYFFISFECSTYKFGDSYQAGFQCLVNDKEMSPDTYVPLKAANQGRWVENDCPRFYKGVRDPQFGCRNTDINYYNIYAKDRSREKMK